ncbi:MAG: lipopolysaccharide biosynthesis protein [Saccharofermentanales bacterium]|nr:lipopolysaccharide biosynthesis protein [Bacillota bacterium]
MSNKIGSNKISKALQWSTISEITSRLIAPITNIVLARLLTPDAFGLVATVTMVVTFAEVFTDAGFQKYIVQHEFEDDVDLDISTNVAFWTNLFFSLFIYTVIAVFANPISTLVGSEGEGKSIIVACMAIPIVAFSSIQMARFRRSFDFRSLFFARLVTSVTPILVTIPLAIALKNHWALIIGTLVSELVNAIVLSAMSQWKPTFTYSLEKLREMLSFSLWSMFEQISIWLTGNLDIFIVGKMLNDYYLGLYKTSMTVVNGYMRIITAATTPVLFSALSRCQSNDTEFRMTFFKFQRLVSVLIMPMGIGLFLYRDLVTYILLGSQWTEASGFIGLWALTSSITIIFGHYNSEAYRSKGKPKLSLLAQIIHLVFLIAVLLVVAPLGFKILYIGRSLARIQLIMTGLVIMWVIFRISTWSIIKNVYPAVVSALLMGVLSYGLQMISFNTIWRIITIFICATFYIVILMCFRSIRTEILALPIIKKVVAFVSGKKKSQTLS